MISREIREYITVAGKNPFREWLEDLGDSNARARIRVRLRKFSLGNAGDVKPVGAGVYELKFHFGPGYRIYFGYNGSVFVLLLCGGDKSSQNKDIHKAKDYWQDFLRRKDK